MINPGDCVLIREKSILIVDNDDDSTFGNARYSRAVVALVITEPSDIDVKLLVEGKLFYCQLANLTRIQ